MRYAFLAAAILIAAPAASLAAGTANGRVTAVDAGSLTVRVAESEVAFSVDEQTSIVAPGAPKTPERPSITELVTVGRIVQVRYDETDMRASSIRVMPVLKATAARKPPVQKEQ